MDPKLKETLDAIKASFGKAIPDPRMEGIIFKANTFGQSGSPTSGLTFYDLEAGAKFLYPVHTPLRNWIPRVSGRGGIQAAWRAITGINSGLLEIGVSEGNRGGVMAVTTSDYTASYKGIGIEDNVTFEAQYAGQNFDDIRAIAVKAGLEACMIGEEQIILGGNGSAVALGTTPTPSLAGGTTGGGLSDATYSVIAVALTHAGVYTGSVPLGIRAQVSRTNADGSSDTYGGGAGRKSAAASVTLSAGTAVQKISATVAAVNGAVGYAWFWGAAGSEVLGAITTINSVVIIAAAAGTQTAASLGTGDNSQNNLVFDGLLYQAFKSGSGAYIKVMATGTAGVGTTLTGDGAGGIVEIDEMLASMWNNYKLGPDTLWVSSQVAQNLSAKILAGNANGAMRFVFDAKQGAIGGGTMVVSYLNKFSMGGATVLDIRIHPNMPAGTILATTGRLPYPMANVTNIMQIKTRQEYYQIEWPLVTRKYQYGVYADEVLQHYFPPSLGVITNIAPG